jgi:hypothetical protein
MRIVRLTFVAACAAVLFLASSAAGQFKVLHTKHQTFIYGNPLHEFLVPYTMRCFENALQYHSRFWDYQPWEPVTVTLFDIGDYGNAGATAIPINRVAVFMAPTSYVYETSPANERINTMMNHELVHVMALDKASGSDRFFRRLFFGKVKEIADNPLTIAYGYLTVPRISAPRWYHEGIAVFMETWMAGGLGRAQGAYDEMVFRTMVRDSVSFYDPVGLESEAMATDFQVGIMAYLYGTRFFDYLAYTRGPDLLRQWVSRTPDSRAYFSRQFKRVYGMSLDDVWSQWIGWEQTFQQANLAAISAYPTTRYRAITDRPLGSLSRAYFDGTGRKLYAGVNYPGEIAHIAEIDIDNGRTTKVCDIKGGAIYYVTSLAYDSLNRTLFFTTDNDEWRDLRAVDLNTGKVCMLQEDARIGDLVFSYADSSLWGVKHFNGISTLVRIPRPYNKWNQIYSLPYGRTLYDIDISPDGSRITGALAYINGRQELILWDIPKLMAGDTTFQRLFDFGVSNPAGFVFTPDGKYLYGASYYSGVSNIFRYDFAADSMEAVTNAETGFFRPLPISDDSLVVFHYTSRGFVPAVIADTIIEDINPIRYLGTAVVDSFPEIRNMIVAPPSAIDLDSLIIDTGDYRPLANMDLVSAYPVVEGYKDFAAFGMRFNLAEPVGLHRSDLTVSYTPNRRLPENQRFHLGWNYEYKEWNLNFHYNGADFYDLFGPTKTSRKGYALSLQYTKYLIYDGPRQMQYGIHVAGYGDLERMPDYQNVATTYNKFMTVNAHLGYSHQQASLGAVDYEKGYKWQTAVRGTYVRKQFHPLFFGLFDYGVPALFHHSSLWLRLAGGYSPGDLWNPFANFFFGGFGNNWVDYRTEKRYRQHYAFPGVELNDIAGTNFGKATVEWNVPPLRFRHLGTTSFYVTWARLALFTSGIITNMDEPLWRRKTGAIGAQLDIRLTLLSHLRLTLSAGYAAAFERAVKPTDEFMFSVKVL